MPGNRGSLSLDEAITQAASRIAARLPAGTGTALVNIHSPTAAFSSYVLDGLEAALVNNGALVVLDRAHLDAIRAEQGFQASGEVSDASAKAIGHLLGADAIITGSLTRIGAAFRLSVKAIEVEKAAVAASFAVDIAADERVRARLTGDAGLAQSPLPAPSPAPERAFAPGVLGGAWAATVTYTADGRSYRDRYRISLFAGGVCRVSVSPAEGAAWSGEGIWSAENGEFRLDCEFGNAAAARLGSVHWMSLYALQNNNRALRVNVRPAPGYAGVVAVTFYKE
ncbi:MAG: CsgG/HfaB family protein [Treponema sp.]|nr:CsgG/HfaB family protein [Treponema sp.]